jgi:hypothetical protein
MIVHYHRRWPIQSTQKSCRPQCVGLPVPVCCDHGIHAKCSGEGGMEAEAMVWPLGIYFILVIFIVVGMLTVSYFLGQRH